MYILRPYPDELLGSLLHRATRQLGISQKRLMPILSGVTSTYAPMVIARQSGFARACGMDHAGFIQRHTLLPYMLAFMPKSEQDRLLGAVLSTGGNSASISAAAQNASKTTARLRFCQQCITEDLRRYGDAYWRRSHQLPGVALCIVHGGRLRVSDIGIRSPHALMPPDEAKGSLMDSCRVPYDVLWSVTRISVAALNNDLPRHDWTTHYRAQAAKLGYGFKGTQIIGEVLSNDLQTYYGQAYLQTLGLRFQPGKRNTWPAIMFRASMINSTALKHVLLNGFLASSPTPSRSPTEVLRRPKARPRNWSHIENQLIDKLNQEIEKCKAAGERITVKELAALVGAEQVLHHHRKKVPNLQAWLEAFKATPESERQTGKRPRVYKKNTI